MRAHRLFAAPRLLPCLAASATFHSVRSVGSAVNGPLTTANIIADFRRYCTEQGAATTGPTSGVDLGHFVSFLQRTRNAGPAAEDTVRRMEIFSITGTRISFDAAKAEALAETENTKLPCYADIAHFADALPDEGLASEDAKELLQEMAPQFHPRAVGALTLREGLSRYKALLTVERDGADWSVRRAPDAAVPSTPSETATASASEPLQDTVAAEDDASADADAAADVETETADLPELPTAAPVAPGEPTARAPRVPVTAGEKAFEADLIEAITREQNRRGVPSTEWIDIEDVLRQLPGATPTGLPGPKYQEGGSSAPAYVTRAARMSAKATAASGNNVGAASSSSSAVSGSSKVKAPPVLWGDLMDTTEIVQINPKLFFRPRRRTRQNGAFVFVDADGMTAAEIDEIAERLRLNARASTTVVVRQSQTAALTAADVVAPHGVPTYMIVEAQAAAVERERRMVLRDVVFMCADAKKHLYEKGAAVAVPFPDAEVYVATPTAQVVVSSWRDDVDEVTKL